MSGLDSLIPGLEDLLPGLEDLFNLDDPQSLQDLPGLQEMLEEMFGFNDLPPDVQQLLDCIDQIANASDKEALYLARVQQLLDSQAESSKLGLYRIALEGCFELYASFDNGVVTVIATRNMP